MDIPAVPDTWERGNPYEQYIGRWSRRVAPLFLAWLRAPAGRRWADVGCGTGALAGAILDGASPTSLVAIDPSEGFREAAAQQLGGRAQVLAGSADALPLADGACDVLVCGLVLNFVPDVAAGLREMARVTAAGGMVAGYVWDYAEDMQVIRAFWDAAAALDPAAVALHEGTRFPLCHPRALRQAFSAAGLEDVETTPLEMRADFADFEDYWRPFLGGQGPAPAYVASLTQERRSALREHLRQRLASVPDQPISLPARAWAVRGRVAGAP